jgi:type I restriction enzyme S subunit
MAGEWKELSLRDAGIQLLDCDHKTPTAVQSGRPYIAIPQIKAGRIDASDARRISESDFQQWTRKTRPQAWDVVLSRRCNPGETAFVPPEFEFALGQNLVLLRSDGKVVFPPFLRWLVRSQEWWGQVNRFINAGAVFESLKCADIPNFRLPIPPLTEQKAIACNLGALDDKIELNQRRNQTLEAMARAVFQSWFIDFDPVRAKAEGRKPAGLSQEIADLFPDSFEDSELGEIPKGWRVGPIRDLCQKVENGGTPKRDIQQYWKPAEVRWLTSGELRQQFIVETDNFISQSGLENSSAKIWPPFSTVVALYGATAGIASLLGIELCTNQACCGLIPFSETACFIHQVLSSSLTVLQQQARGSAQQNLSQAIVAEHRCVVPSKQLLAAFEKHAHPLYDRCIGGIAESRTLASLRDTLLPKLISGELRVPDAERIVGRAV